MVYSEIEAYSEVEREIIFLKAAQESIDEMVNYEVLSLIGEDPQLINRPDKYAEIGFESITHQKHFNIILVDFLSRKLFGERLSCLEAVRKVCENPHFNVDGSVDSLSVASREFTEWLEQDGEVDVWLPATEIEAILSIKRIEFIRICGNISKHNFSRLSGVARELIGIFERNNIAISFEDALLIFNDFYERFHGYILRYHIHTIVEFLNNIRWGIHEYLRPEFLQSIEYYKDSNEYGDDRDKKYRYTYPAGVEGKFSKAIYWELMNEIRGRPIVREFKVARHWKLRY